MWNILIFFFFYKSTQCLSLLLPGVFFVYSHILCWFDSACIFANIFYIVMHCYLFKVHSPIIINLASLCGMLIFFSPIQCSWTTITIIVLICCVVGHTILLSFCFRLGLRTRTSMYRLAWEKLPSVTNLTGPLEMKVPNFNISQHDWNDLWWLAYKTY